MTSHRVPIPTSRPLHTTAAEWLRLGNTSQFAVRLYSRQLTRGRVWKYAVSGELKMRLFLAFIEPVMLYGSETWTLTVYLTKRLNGCYTRFGQGLDVPQQEDQRRTLRCSTKYVRGHQEQTRRLCGELRLVH